jgi:hypothetical protein
MITFLNGANSITIPLPLYGYTVDISMSFKISVAADGTRTIWDDTAALVPDKRILSGCKFQLSASYQHAFQDFLTDETLGRCENIIMRLGATPTGFYPFGPDLGDVGDFTCRIIENETAGALFSPWLHFESGLSFTLVTPPSYSLPDIVSEGSFQIGTVTGLRLPQAGFKVERENNFKTVATNTGAPYSIDGLTASDQYLTSWSQEGNASLAGALISFLKSTSGRGADITIIAPTKYYMKGAENNSGGTYTTKLLSNVLSITHNRFDEFSIPMNVWMKAAA